LLALLECRTLPAAHRHKVRSPVASQDRQESTANELRDSFS